MATKKLHFETLQLHVGQEQPDPATDARAVPIYQTTSYVFHNAQHAADRFGLRDAGNIYGRLTNSTQGVFEARVAALEGGVAGLAVASGAAAVTYALQNIVRAGDHIIAADNLYGGSFNLITHTLASQGITNTIINVNDLNALEAAIRENTKAIYVETFGNPNSDVTNLDAVAEVAHRYHVPLIVDNTFGTPYLIRPIEHGADIVIHSATKFIGGHGSSLGGVIVDGGTFDWKANADKFPTLAKPDPSYHGAIFADVAGSAAFVTRIRAVILRDTGATISPFNAFILLQGLETLSLRVERHVANALKVVDYLSKHPKVEKVNHPSLPTHPDHELYNKYFPNGAGSIFTFEIKGGQETEFFAGFYGGAAEDDFLDFLILQCAYGKGNGGICLSRTGRADSEYHIILGEAFHQFQLVLAPGNDRLSGDAEHNYVSVLFCLRGIPFDDVDDNFFF